MAYHLKIRSRTEPVIMPDDTGKQFADAWLAGKLPDRVEVARGISVLSTHIDSVEYVPPPAYPKSDAPDLTPAQRAENLKRLATMREKLWGKATGRDTGHYTEAHRLARCACFRPEEWPHRPQA